MVVLPVGVVQPAHGSHAAGCQVQLQELAGLEMVGESELELPLQQGQWAQV